MDLIKHLRRAFTKQMKRLFDWAREIMIAYKMFCTSEVLWDWVGDIHNLSIRGKFGDVHEFVY